MKTFTFRVYFSLLFVILLMSSILLIANDEIPVIAAQPSLLKLLIGAILLIYEIIVRLIPSVGNYSVIAFIIDILKKISDALDRKKNV